MAESRDRSRSPIRDYQSDPAGRPPPEESAKLYIGNLAWRVDSNTLRDEFGKIGTVTDAYVANDRETGRSRGFGFVTFADAAQAREAKEKLDNADLGGRLIRIDFASQKGPSTGGRGGGGGGFRSGSSRGGFDDPPRDRGYDRGGPDRSEASGRGPRGGYEDRAAPLERERGDRYGAPPSERYGGPPDRGYDRYGPPPHERERERYGAPPPLPLHERGGERERYGGAPPHDRERYGAPPPLPPHERGDRERYGGAPPPPHDRERERYGAPAPLPLVERDRYAPERDRYGPVSGSVPPPMERDRYGGPPPRGPPRSDFDERSGSRDRGYPPVPLAPRGRGDY